MREREREKEREKERETHTRDILKHTKAHVSKNFLRFRRKEKGQFSKIILIFRVILILKMSMIYEKIYFMLKVLRI